MPFDFTPGAGKTKGARPKPPPVVAGPATSGPLAGVGYTDSLETDAGAELSALGKAFKTRRDREDDRFRATIDSEYWLAVCFRSREHKEAFLTALKVPARLGDKYVDGHQLARLLGIELPD